MRGRPGLVLASGGTGDLELNPTEVELLSNPRAIRNLAIALVILALADASCADGDDEDPGTALGTPDQVSTTVAETTTTAAPTPEEEVLAPTRGTGRR